MTETENYKLKKPEESEYIGPAQFNENANVIDAELKKAEEHRGDHTAHVTAEEKDAWNNKAPGSLADDLSEHAGDANVHILTLTHAKPGTVHALTGLLGASGTVSAVFTATDAYTAGDTITIDGESYAIQLSNGETAEANLFVAGATVSIVVDTEGKKVNFKAGGGLSKSKLAAATATAATVLKGKTFYAGDDVLKTGTMVAGYKYEYKRVSVSSSASLTLSGTPKAIIFILSTSTAAPTEPVSSVTSCYVSGVTEDIAGVTTGTHSVSISLSGNTLSFNKYTTGTTVYVHVYSFYS